MLASKRTALNQNESGFAALVIGIVLVLVVSLVTVGFAQLMQQEQTSALNKQLSSQAYYAAESGINDAAKAIDDGYTGAKSTCGPDTSVPDLSDNTIGGSAGPTDASYPCLLIDPSPPNLEFNPISISGSKVIKLEGVDPATSTPTPIDSIIISWKDSAGGDSFAPLSSCQNPTSFSPASQWTYTGLLRFELIPISSLDRQSLINNEFTTFLCPGSGSGTYNTVNYSPGFSSTNGPVVSGNCSPTPVNPTYEPNYCNVKITNLPSGQSTYYIDMQSIYSPTSVVVEAFDNNDGSGNPDSNNLLDAAGAQTLIDSTGKAENVLRRIQVRISSQNGYNMPTGTHAEDDICKQLEVSPGASQSASSCDIQ